MSEDDTAIQAEGCADLIRIFTKGADKPRVIDRETPFLLPEVFGVTDLEKTPEEDAAVREVTEAINGMRQRLLGLEARPFSLERVHVLTTEELHAKVIPERFSGKTMFGHVYLPRNRSLVEFQAVLAHEMVHAFSYLWLDLHSDDAEAWPGEKWKAITIRRTGLALVDPSFGTWLPHFHGLNEGVTETLALMVRGMLSHQSKVLGEEGKKRIACWMSSPPLVRFTDALVQIVAGDGNSVDVWRVLARDIFEGKDEFLKALEPKLPGATDRLRRTGGTPPELLAAANDLGLTDVAKYVAKYCK